MPSAPLPPTHNRRAQVKRAKGKQTHFTQKPAGRSGRAVRVVSGNGKAPQTEV